MEENKGLEMGVEESSAANLETEPVTNEEVVVVEENPSQEGNPEPATEPDNSSESKFEKAFSKRLSKVSEKIRQEVATEYEAKLSKFERVLSSAAKEYGISTEEYVDELLDQYKEEGVEGSKPSLDSETMALLEELKTEKSEKEFQQEKKAYWDRQAKQLLDIGVTDLSLIPEEVLERALENDTEIAFEYLKYDKQQAIEQTRRDTIRNIQDTESPGSLSGGGGDDTIDIARMKWNDPKFEKLKQEVLSGQRKSL